MTQLDLQRRYEQVRLHEWARSCLSKVRYRSHDIASKRARMIAHKRRTKLYVYCCPHCCGFHLTKRAPQR